MAGGDTGGRGVSVLEHIIALLNERDRRYQQRFDDQTTAINAALQAAKEAVTKAESAAEKRFELLNELRDGVATAEQLDALEKVVGDLAARVDRFEGRSTGLSAGWGYLVGAAGVVGAVIAVIVGL